MPALLTRISRPPNSRSLAAIAARQSFARVTSRCSATAALVAALALISSAVCLQTSSSTSPTTTLAPSLANSRASAAPCPRAPPEMRATLPLSLSILKFLRLLPGALRPGAGTASPRRQTAIHHELRTGHVRCLVAGQNQYRLGDL